MARPTKPEGAPIAPYSYLTPEEKEAICAAVAENFTISAAVRAAFGDDKRLSAVLAAIRNDPVGFGAAIERSREAHRDTIRAKVRELALGYEKALVNQGVPTGFVTIAHDIEALKILCRTRLPEFLDKRSASDVHVHGAIQAEDAPGRLYIDDNEALGLSVEGRRMLGLVLKEIIKNRREHARRQGQFEALTDQSNAIDTEFAEMPVDDFDLAEVERLR